MIRSWMSGWFVVGAGLGLAVAACGGGDETGGEVPDVTPPQIVSSTPAAEASAIGVLTTIAVTLDEPIDPATVADAIALYARFTPERVPGTVTYDETTLTITFTPSLPLLHAERYALRVGATLTDVDGNPFAGSQIAFNTRLNSATVRIDRNASGQQVASTRFTLDAVGRPTEARSYGGAGPDNQWQTADDVVNDRYLNTWGPRGELLAETYYTFGPDGVLGTADDETSSLTTHTWDADVREVSYTNLQGPGADGVWQTADDEIVNLYVSTYQDGLPTRRFQHVGAGADGVWQTDDDRVGKLYEFTAGPDEAPVRSTRADAGADRLPMTADDAIDTVIDFTSVGGLTTSRVYRTAGADGVWLTADDGYSGYERYTRDARGLLIVQEACSGIGVDGLWMTADDVCSLRLHYTYDANGLVVERRDTIGKGSDGVWDTSDDALRSREVLTRDGEGNRIKNLVFEDPGVDLVWNTTDDRIQNEFLYDTTR